jgi:hypothetical protein
MVPPGCVYSLCLPAWRFSASSCSSYACTGAFLHPLHLSPSVRASMCVTHHVAVHDKYLPCISPPGSPPATGPTS